jgi:prepilin-type N-terminal cleavage/methylation domain-containing protein
MTIENYIGPEISMRRRRGFTLTEIAIVLGIMGLILGAIWVAASSVYTNMRISTTTRDVISLSQGVRNLYANQGLMETAPVITSAQLISTGVVPNDMIAGNAFVDAWGGTMTFTPATTISTAGDSFVVDLAGIPQAGCVGLLTDSSTRSTGSGVYGVNAGANAFTGAQTGGNPVLNTTNYTGTSAVGVCTAATNNHVGYAFSIH